MVLASNVNSRRNMLLNDACHLLDNFFSKMVLGLSRSKQNSKRMSPCSRRSVQSEIYERPLRQLGQSSMEGVTSDTIDWKSGRFRKEMFSRRGMERI